METKICGTCKKELPLTYFRKNIRRKDGYQTDCIKCRKEYNKNHYIKNKELYKKRASKRTKELRLWFKEYKKELKCEICGDCRFYVLEFHHKDPTNKKESVSQLIRLSSKKYLLEEIDKCSVLCSNCHKELHYLENDGGVC